MLHLIKKHQNVLFQHLFHAIQHSVDIYIYGKMHFLHRASSNATGKVVRALIVMAENI